MIKKILYISLCVIWLESVEATAYETSIQSHSSDQQNEFEFDNTVDIDIREYINTEEPSAHRHGPGARYRLRGQRCCHYVTVPYGPPIRRYWGYYWEWYQPTTVVTECHIAYEPPIYRRPFPRRSRRPRRSYRPRRQSYSSFYCDQQTRGRENSLFNAVCDHRLSDISDLLEDRRRNYSVDDRQRSTGETALILATKIGDIDIVQLLADGYSADVCMETQDRIASEWTDESAYDDDIGEYLDNRSSHCF